MRVLDKEKNEEIRDKKKEDKIDKYKGNKDENNINKPKGIRFYIRDSKGGCMTIGTPGAIDRLEYPRQCLSPLWK